MVVFYKQELNSFDNVPTGKTVLISQPGIWGRLVNNLIQSPIFHTLMKDTWIISLWTEDIFTYF